MQHVRRTMACQILGLANAGVTQKFGLFVKALAQETGKDDLDARRETVSGWLADQGVDLSVGDCPNADSDGIAGLIARLKAGAVDVSRGEVRAGYFFPSAVTVPEMLHIFFNGLQESLESSEAWKPFEAILRDLVTTVGSRMWRDRSLGLCMAGAPQHERRLMRTFDGHKFDWRWEVLVVVVVVVVIVLAVVAVVIVVAVVRVVLAPHCETTN